MRALVQRVRRASVCVVPEGHSEHDTEQLLWTGAIERGLLVYLGVGHHDGPAEVQWMVRKLLGLRVFEDAHGKANHNVLEARGSVLVVSQFTLYGDCLKGNRPSFAGAARPEHAEPMYNAVCDQLAAHLPTQRGQFRADMRVHCVVDGPFTLWLEHEPKGAHARAE